MNLFEMSMRNMSYEKTKSWIIVLGNLVKGDGN